MLTIWHHICQYNFRLGCHPFCAPAQLANANAVQASERTWESQIDGALWTQQALPYQANCLWWTNECYQALDSAGRARVDTLITGTGVETVLFQS